MRKLRNMAAVILCFASVTTYAIDENKAIGFYRVGLFESAKEMLQNSIAAKDKNAAECYFFLGKIAIKEEKIDSAQYFFTKGIEADPNYPFNYVGKAQLLIGKDDKQAKSIIDELVNGKYKKDPMLRIAVARAYLESDSKEYDDIKEHLQKDYPELGDLFILEADHLLKKKDPGSAGAMYEQAIHFNPKSEEAYVKYAQLYAHASPKLSIEMLNKFLEQEPSSILARRELAETYFAMANYPEAAKNYELYMTEEVRPSTHDLLRYATILFMNKEYDKSSNLVEQLHHRDPGKVPVNRLKMYLSIVLNKSDQEELANEFMKKYKPEEYIALDHYYYGQMLKNKKQYDQALVEMEKAVQMDSSKNELVRDMISIYEETENYPKAIATYNLLLKSESVQIKLSDYLLLGKDYYYMGNKVKETADSIQQIGYFQKADSLFAIVAEKSPANYLGHFWRARASSAIDSETTRGLAKPFYEKALSILEPDGKEKDKIIECYNYLGYYYYITNDYTNSLIYWNKTLALNPNNEVAKKAIEGISKQQKKNK